MQRKNNILNTRHNKRSGIAMIMAIAVIVIISTIMALSLSLTSQTTKQTTDLYLYEQVMLLSKSATEYGILRATQATPCSVNALNLTEGVYDINISMKYIYNAPSPCATADNYFDVVSPEQSGSVLMDVTVSTAVGTEPIRYFRRTLQKL